MTLDPGPRHALIERHLLMAQRCNALAAELHQNGEGEAAARQRQLLAVFLHNVLMQLPPAGEGAGSGHATGSEPAPAPGHLQAAPAPALAGAAPVPDATGPLHWVLHRPAAAPFRPLP